MNSKLLNIIKKNQRIIFNKLNNLIKDDNEILTKAIRYSLLQNSKRLRSLLILETYKLFNKKINNNIITVATAIEMIHIFSLIHDDLPSMDNDDYRRGELTCHKKFNEYNAILAGDSLIFLCFETIINKTTLTNKEKLNIISIISKAVGYKGMCLGQSKDIEFEKSKKLKTSKEAENINLYKTGLLFQCCIEIGCILGKASKIQKKNLIEYSINFGKAFQLKDDIEDNEITKKDLIKVKNEIFNLIENCKKNIKNFKNNENLKLIAEYCLID